MPCTSIGASFSIGHITMAIKIVVSNTVKFKVRGTIKDEAGIDQPFDFTLTCARLDADQIQAKLRGESEASVTDFLADVVEDWAGVKDAGNNAIPYSEESLRQLCRITGVAALTFKTYLSEVGAKEKN